ncbi:MAG: glycosyltransferase [Candidatus Nanohaloarchaea archaeon]|nr:glycosyltransferase [Candidatus Nanohaloarchaea archaeon]
MRVAYFTETYFPQINGVTYAIDGWRQELRDRGHDVTVVYPETPHDPREGEHPVTGVELGIVDGYRQGAAFPSDISDRIGSVDVVHGHGPFSLGILGQRVAKKQGVPFVATHHTPLYRYFDYISDQPELHAAFYAAYRAWERLFYRSCDAALAPSTYTARQLQQRIGRPVTPITNGVDTATFRPVDGSFRAAHGLDGERVAGYCGRLGHEKGIDDLIAFADRFDGHVLVAGDGFARDHYEPRFAAHDSITYLGRLDRGDMPAFYSSLDLFILPSTVETQGLTVLEANACGTPAVGADAMALTETIRDGRNGYRYTPRDVDALCAAVDRAYDEHAALVEGARAVAAEHSIDAAVDGLLDIYTRLAE